MNLCLAAVWRNLGGPELRGRRARAFWRDGDGPNVSVDLRRGLWFDHVQGTGGGVISLVGTVLGCSRREAIVWLRQNHHLPKVSATWVEQCAWNFRRRQADQLRQQALFWHSALLQKLTHEKAEAYDRWCEAAERRDRDSAESFLKEWAVASARLFAVESLGGPALIDRFAVEQRRDPIRARRLVELGRQDRLNAETITAQVVRTLSSDDSGRRLAA